MTRIPSRFHFVEFSFDCFNEFNGPKETCVSDCNISEQRRCYNYFKQSNPKPKQFFLQRLLPVFPCQPPATRFPALTAAYMFPAPASVTSFLALAPKITCCFTPVLIGSRTKNDRRDWLCEMLVLL